MLSIAIQKKLHFAFGKKDLDVQLDIPSGQLLAIVGESGSGKTTLLRLLAGLTKPDRGHITFEQKAWVHTAQGILLSPQQRSIGFVFQDYALFPNMTVVQNLRFALPKGQAPSIIDELLDITDLVTLADRRPATLSGGQQQRTALARALVRQPRLLLLDEPLSALDTELRNRLQLFIREVHERYQLTTLLVSHNRDEILKLADSIVRIERGEVVQWATPQAFFQLENADSGQLRGEVLRLSEKDGQGVADILVGANVLSVPIDQQVLQPGMRVHLRLSPKGQWKLCANT